MRILIITSWATDVIGGSGTAVFFNTFLSGLRNQGYDVEVIAPNFDTSDYLEVTLQRFLFNAELRTDPRVQAADLIIGFDYDGYALDPNNRPPMIASAHAIYGDVLRWETDPVRTMVQAQAYFDKVSMARADIVITGSEYAKSRLVALYGLDPAHVMVIPHGLNPAPWMQYVGAEPLPANQRPTVLSVGKMYPRKRTDILLRAIPILCQQYPDLDVRIIGNGLEWDNLQKLSRQLKITDNITWLSHIKDDRVFAREWQRADVFAHPSSQESFGYVYLEAMLLGKPIVTPDSSAGPEVVGDAGLFVAPESPEALAEGISKLLADSALRAAYGQRGQQRAKQFSHEAMIGRYTEVINSMARVGAY
jgi:glycosyltransferase involved in cell wall biosynthesis